MSYDPQIPFDDGQTQKNPEPEDTYRTVPIQQNFEAEPAGFLPSDYEAPTIAYGSPPPPPAVASGSFSQGFPPTIPMNGNLPPATTEPRKKRPGNKTLWITGVSILALLLLAIGALVILPDLTASASNPASDPTPVAMTTPTASATTPANKGGNARYLAQYRNTIRSQIAQGLNLPVAQLIARLKGGATLTSIASAQGISSSQLQTIVKNAFQQGYQPAINSGNLTQKQVNSLTDRMLKQPQTLDRYLDVQPRNGTKAKASPTPTA